MKIKLNKISAKFTPNIRFLIPSNEENLELKKECKMNHECIICFETRKIDDCTGEGSNRCYGTNPMILEVWFEDQDGTECYLDNWQQLEVNFCPFCGLKADK